MDAQEVLRFWFEETAPEKRFKKDEGFDEEIRERFGFVHQQATRGELWSWRETLGGRLAEVIVLDQFSRNMYRNQPDAFRYDGMALILAQEALRQDGRQDLSVEQRAFLYMPFMHSESLVIHDTAMKLFAEEGMESFYIYEQQHRAIIARFGRYPHRNLVLQRESTEEEIRFLQEEHAGF